MKPFWLFAAGLLCAQAGAARGAALAGMTEEQSRKYAAASAVKAEALKPHLERQKNGLRRLRELIAADKPESEVQRELDSLKDTSGAIQEIQGRYESALASFMTPDQRAKLAFARAVKAKKLVAAAKVGADAQEASLHVPGDEEEKE